MAVDAAQSSEVVSAVAVAETAAIDHCVRDTSGASVARGAGEAAGVTGLAVLWRSEEFRRTNTSVRNQNFVCAA